MIPVEIGKKYMTEIKSVSSEGSGVCSINGYTIFVPQTVRGDVILTEIVKTKSSYGIGRVKDIITPSPYRVKPACRYCGSCGGCSLMNMSYEEQLRVKRDIVRDALVRIGGFKDLDLEEICGMDLPERYRNKLVLRIGTSDEGCPAYGFYANKSHSVVPVTDCIAASAESGRIAAAVTEYMKENNITAYNERTGRGLIRGIFLRGAFWTGEIMTVIYSVSEKLPHTDDLVKRLRNEGADSIILNVNKKRSQIMSGNKNIILYGNDYITDTILGVKYIISHDSFFQINPIMTEKLYAKALDYAGLSGRENVMDIYCGIGAISLCAAKHAKKVIGIEYVRAAVRDAERNMELNGITNAEFYEGSAEKIVPKLINNGMRPDTVILDPPRKGSDEITLSQIVKAEPCRIVYVSCNPSTLARDMRFLADRGYYITKAAPFDMFPYTHHVETIMLLQRQDT